jgi:glutamate transport system ATP-binding protein
LRPQQPPRCSSPAQFFDHPESDRAKDFLSKILEH